MYKLITICNNLSYWNEYSKQPSQNFSLHDCIALYLQSQDASWCEKTCFLAAAAGLPASFVVQKQPHLNQKLEYRDLTCFYSFYPTPVNNACKYTGYAFEVIQKFGGVYNHTYYKYRIIENLMLNKPVIARIHVFTHNWCLIIGYDDVRDAVYLRLANGTIWVSNWYELCEEIVLFAKKRYSETANLTREQYKGMYSNYTHMLPDDFSMGEQAFYDWKKLFELKVSEQAVLDYSCFLFRQLQKNRTLMAQMIIEWHGNHTAAGIACLRHLKLLLQQLEKICNIIALERRECLTAIDCVSTIDVNILKEWEHYLADTNINNAPFQNDIITKNKAERSEK